MSAELPPERRARTRAGRRPAWRWLLGLAVAAALLAFALANVPWRDTLTVAGPDASGSETYTGEIQGDWTASRITFHFDPRAGPAADAPLAGHPLASAVELGGELEVTRSSLRGRVWTRSQAGRPTPIGDVRELGSVQAEWRPGLPGVFRELEPSGLLPALGLLFTGTLLIATRWWRLLAVCGCRTRWWTAFRLLYVGLFFNLMVPGSTGGDVARAFAVVRDHPTRRARALTSILVDRVVGMIALALIAAVAVLTNDARFGRLRLAVVLVLAGLIVAAGVLSSPPLRRLLRLDALAARLPRAERLSRIDAGLHEYTRHPRAVGLALLLSCASHLCAMTAIFWIGRTLGDALPFHDYVSIAGVAQLLTAIPIAPAGLGVGEVLYGTLFELAGGLYLLGVATSLVYRLTLALLGLAGGALMLLPGGDAVRRGLREARAAEATAHEPLEHHGAQSGP